MGYDTYIYLGPYVEAKNSKRPFRKNQRSCTNTQCSRYEDYFNSYESFCSTCGSVISEITIVNEIKVVDRHEIANKTDLFTLNTYHMKDLDKQIDLFIGNKEEKGRVKIFTLNNEGVKDLSNIVDMTETEIAEFKELYEKGIQLIEESYGRNNYEIKWGLIIYGF